MPAHGRDIRASAGRGRDRPSGQGRGVLRRHQARSGFLMALPPRIGASVGRRRRLALPHGDLRSGCSAWAGVWVRVGGADLCRGSRSRGHVNRKLLPGRRPSPASPDRARACMVIQAVNDRPIALPCKHRSSASRPPSKKIRRRHAPVGAADRGAGRRVRACRGWRKTTPPCRACPSTHRHPPALHPCG